MTMANDPATSSDDEQLVQLLREVHEKLQRPETINLALHNYAMTEIANAIVAQGLKGSGQIDLPISVISRVIDDAPEHADPPVTTTCISYAISVLGATRSCMGDLRVPEHRGDTVVHESHRYRGWSVLVAALAVPMPGSPMTQR